MTAALAPRHAGSAPVIMFHGGTRTSRYVSDLLAGYQLELASVTPKVVATPASPWLDRIWRRAQAVASEDCWSSVPEDVLDSLEDAGRRLLDADAEFLAHMAVSAQVPQPAAVAAIRLIGMLGEDGYLSPDQVLVPLRDALVHDQADRRHYAVKALWLARVAEAAPLLRRRLLSEPHAGTVALIRRAVEVLESR